MGLKCKNLFMPFNCSVSILLPIRQKIRTDFSWGWSGRSSALVCEKHLAWSWMHHRDVMLATCKPPEKIRKKQKSILVSNSLDTEKTPPAPQGTAGGTRGGFPSSCIIYPRDPAGTSLVPLDSLPLAGMVAEGQSLSLNRIFFSN